MGTFFGTPGSINHIHARLLRDRVEETRNTVNGTSVSLRSVNVHFDLLLPYNYTNASEQKTGTTHENKRTCTPGVPGGARLP